MVGGFRGLREIGVSRDKWTVPLSCFAFELEILASYHVLIIIYPVVDREISQNSITQDTLVLSA
jgi:hypothetical protein